MDDLRQVFAKHQMAMLGTIRFYHINSENDFNPDTLKVSYQLDNQSYWGAERGDFVVIECDKIEKPASAVDGYSVQILDREALVRGGVKSLLDDKTYYSRKDYDDHAERLGKVLVGSDFQSQTKARQDRMAERAERRREQASELAKHS